jgi:hypothetical protein
VEKKAPSESSYLPSRWLALAVVGLSGLLIVGVRARLFDFPLERDEGEYAYMGQLILQGVPPYQLAANMKMPGIYLAYAAIMAFFGQSPAGIHLGLLLVHLATMVILFFVARNFLDLYGAVVSTTAYGMMILSPSYLGLAAHATHFVVLPVLAGTLILTRKNPGLPACFAAGFLFGVAFLMKQTGAIFGCWGGIYLIWMALAERMAWRQILARAAIYSAGCVLPFLAVCLWLKIAGVFPQFWFWTFTYIREYATAISFGNGVQNAYTTVARIFHSASLLYILAGIGLGCLCFRRLEWNKRIFLISFFVFSALAVCPDLYFRKHYFIVLAPAVALLAGLAVSWLSRCLAEKFQRPWLVHLGFLLGVMACMQTLCADQLVLLDLSPREACRAVYGINPFPEALDIARYIEENSGKNQRVFVLGDEPEIYFYSHRLSSNSQIYPSQTMDPRPYAHKMQERMISEVEQNPPEFLVYCSIYNSLLQKPDSDPMLTDWAKKYVKENMQFTSPTNTETSWGADVTTTQRRSPYFILIFKRPTH